MMSVADHPPAVRKMGDGNRPKDRSVVFVRMRLQDVPRPEHAISDQPRHLHHLMLVANLVMHGLERVKLQ